MYRKDNKTPFQVVPWDYDHSFGRDGDNEPHLPGIISIERNLLLKRLIQLNTNEYTTRLKNRFNELKTAGILNEENLIAKIEANYSRLRPFVKKNEQRWPVDAAPFYDNADFEDEIQLIKGWIPIQLKEMDKHINKF